MVAAEIEAALAPVAQPLMIDAAKKPFVILVAGVNGSGKTTTIGKLAAKFRAEGRSVMLAAGDTFRAAAIEQLKIWGERTGAPVIAREAGADAAGLAFDAVRAAKERGVDVLLIDTAGRLQNRTELMNELEKIVRVIKKVDPSAPHAVLLVLDATVGQNALSQVEMFRKAVGVTGLVMTKLDGTARGGILVAIAAKFPGAGALHRRRRKRRRSGAVLGAGFRPRRRRARFIIEAAIRKAQANMTATTKPQLNPLLKLAFDLGPLVLFFFANSRYGIFVATGTFMVAVLAALAASYVLTRQLPIMPVVTAIIVLVFGGLTLILHNDVFIKIKPTILYALFGAVLLGGLFFGKSFLGIVFNSLFHLTDEGWRKLTLRWAIFFFVLAVLNEIVWRNTSTDVWVDFKVFGFLPLTFLFGALQYPLLRKYAVEPAE